MSYLNNEDYILEDSMHVLQSITLTQQWDELQIGGVLSVADPLYSEALQVVSIL